MRKIEIVFLLLAVLLTIFIHSFYFREVCYDRDVAGYIYNDLSVLEGKGWYYTTWHTKPPGINFIILAAFSLFGKSFKSIYLFALFFNLLSIFLIYLLSRKTLSKETKLYFLLPLFFALFFVSEPFRTYSANTEVFLAPFEIGGMLFLGLNQYLISGLFLGLGFLIRQTGLYAFIAGILFMIVTNALDKRSFKALIKNLLGFTAIFILPLVLISLYFLDQGVFDKFFNYTFIYNLRLLGEYVTDVRKRDLLFTKRIFWMGFKFEIILFGLLSLIAFFSTIIHRTKPRLLVSIWFVVVLFWLLISGIYPHHFTQIIAPIASISLLGLSDTIGGIKRLFKGKAYLKNMFIIILAIILLIPYVRLIAPFITKKRPRYAFYPSKDRFDAAQYIKERAGPQDKIFVWDNLDGGAIFLWSERESATSFHEKYAFLPAELREYWIPYVEDYQFNQKQLLLELQRNRPKYIVVVLDYGQVIRWRKLIKGDKSVPYLITDMEVREATEAEKNAFPELFQILDQDYQFDIQFSRCSIFRLIR